MKGIPPMGIFYASKMCVFCSKKCIFCCNTQQEAVLQGNKQDMPDIIKVIFSQMHCHHKFKSYVCKHN